MRGAIGSITKGASCRLGAWALAAGAHLFVFAGSAHADLVVSSAATQNVHCSASKCSATAANAVLNVSQLQSMLAAGDATVSTVQTAGPNIVVNAALSWATAHGLTLDAYTSVAVNAPVTVAGTGGLSIITNDGGYNGTLAVADGANVVFWGTSNKLAINRIRYTLVNSIGSLAAAVKAHPAGFFALSKSYDASVDGTYAAAPVAFLQGTFEGLGNTISNLSIKAPKGQIGLIRQTDMYSLIENLKLTNINISSQKPASAGGLLGVSFGTVSNVSVSGKVTVPGNGAAGLIAGISFFGEISNSRSSGTVRGLRGGGLLGDADAYTGPGTTYILNSSSTASIATPKKGYGLVGGLVGYAYGVAIANSWASGTVTGGSQAWAGGLTASLDCGIILASFATGAVSGGDNASVGGLTGVSGDPGGVCGGIFASYATGNVQGGANSSDGGLVGSCGTALVNDFATGQVTGGQGGYVGGLVGWALCGGVDQVSASGNVTGGSATGGLVGFNYDPLTNAYATGTVTGTTGGDAGGLIGRNVQPVSDAYSTGAVNGNGAQYVGGLIGEHQDGPTPYLSHTYWDTSTSGISDPAQGTGNIGNEPGVNGKIDRQLKDGLPNGFSSAIWGQSPQINNGFPYLLGNGFAVAHRPLKFRCSANVPAEFATFCRSRTKP